MLYEWPHPQIDNGWDSGDHQWREVTPAAYIELSKLPRLYTDADAFMQAEPVDILANGEALYACCRRAEGYYFARLLPESDWWELKRLPLPDTGVLSI